MSATIAAESNLLESLLGAIGSAVKQGREYCQSVGLAQENQEEPFWLGMTDYDLAEITELLQHSSGTNAKWPLYGSDFYSKEDEKLLGGQLFIVVDTTHSSIALVVDNRAIATIIAPIPLLCVALRILHIEYGLSSSEISTSLGLNKAFVFFLLYIYNSPIFDTSDPYYLEIVTNVIESVRAVEFYLEQEVVRPRLSVADALRGLHKMKRTDAGELEGISDEANDRFVPLSDAISLLRQERVKKGLTQADIAERMGLKERSVRQIESGANAPSSTTIQRYADALGLVPVLSLLSQSPS